MACSPGQTDALLAMSRNARSAGSYFFLLVPTSSHAFLLPVFTGFSDFLAGVLPGVSFTS
jgi:hypothetical protein